jgi:hypothetical protein
MATELEDRIDRMQAALDALVERDLSKFGAAPYPGGVGIDFSAPLSQAELSNAAHAAVHAVAHLRDHFKRAAKVAGLGKSAVARVIEGSPALQVVIDLSEADKHGADRRNGGRSGRNPKFITIGRALTARTRPGEPTSSVIFKFDGSPPVVESGIADVRVVATVADKDGNLIGELGGILDDAMKAWDALLTQIRDATPGASVGAPATNRQRAGSGRLDGDQPG